MRLNARFELVECSPTAIDNLIYGENIKSEDKARYKDSKKKKGVGAYSRGIGRNGENQQNSYGSH